MQNRTCGALAALAIALVGCVDRPNWCNPGTAPSQQSRTQLFDPFPDPDSGPEVVGARPRDFQKPESEVERSRHAKPAPWQRAPYVVAPGAVPVR